MILNRCIQVYIGKINFLVVFEIHYNELFISFSPRMFVNEGWNTKNLIEKVTSRIYINYIFNKPVITWAGPKLGLITRKSCFQDFRQSSTQTSLLSYKNKVE